jgi:hypothetical protein
MVLGFKFRRLENGFTVKYVVDKERPPGTITVGPPPPSTHGGELYVQDKQQLAACVAMLLDKYTEDK